MKILIADDSKPIRERLVERLSALHGVEVDEAADTHEVLEKLHGFRPDLAVLDIRMPGGGGIKALEQIKHECPVVTVMIMTNYPYAEYRRKCLDAGADFFFDKSTEFEQVAKTVARLLAGSDPKELARRTAAAQLVEAREQLEKTEQRRRDMSIFSLLQRGAVHKAPDDASYEMWEKTFDAIPDMVAVFDANHTIVRVNRAMAARLGVPAAELTGQRCYTCIHGASCPADNCPHEQMLADRKEHSSEFFEERLNAWLNVTVAPILQDGKLIGVVHVARDVTERRQAEDAARRSEKEMRYVIETVSDGLWDWDVIRNRVTCSPQWYQMLGYEPDEFDVSYEIFEGMIHPEDVPKVDEAVRAYFCGENDQYDVEFRFRRKDRTYALIWARAALVERTKEGEPARMMGMHADITGIRRTEEALQASEQRYRQLFSSMQSAFALHEIICDENGVPCDYRFLEVNPAFERLTGLRASQIIGRTIRQVLPETEPQWIEVYGRVALTGHPAHFEEFSGALERWFAVSAYCPRPGQFATIFYDVSDRHEAQETMRRARDLAEESSRIKTQFLANMSHELRTPLNAVIGLAELLEDTPLNDEQRDFVETIGESSEALLKIISDLFDLSRIELGRLDTHREPFAVRAAVQKALSMVEPAAAGKQITLRCDVDEEVPEQIVSDPHRLRQILINLLQNAVKFTAEGIVTLTVKTVRTPSGSRRLDFAVQDSGPGIDEKMQRYIFEPFRQGDSSSTREYGGAGLGLAISRNLARLLGGSLTVKSRPGSGSRFRLSLPLSGQEEDPGAPEPAVSEAWKGRTVCVWSDDPADLRTAEHLLEHHGIRPRYADTLDTIRSRLAEEVPPAAVFLNLDMPGLLEHLPAFRAVHPEVPWIGFSNWGFELNETYRGFFRTLADRPLDERQFCAALRKSDSGSGVRS